MIEMNFGLLEDFIVFGYILNIVGFVLAIVFAIYIVFYRIDIAKIATKTPRNLNIIGIIKRLLIMATPFLPFLITVRKMYILVSDLTDEEKIKKLGD